MKIPSRTLCTVTGVSAELLRSWRHRGNLHLSIDEDDEGAKARPAVRQYTLADALVVSVMKTLVDAGLMPSTAAWIIDGIRTSIEQEAEDIHRSADRDGDVEVDNDRFIVVRTLDKGVEVKSVLGLKMLREHIDLTWTPKRNPVRSVLMLDLSHLLRNLLSLLADPIAERRIGPGSA